MESLFCNTKAIKGKKKICIIQGKSQNKNLNLIKDIEGEKNKLSLEFATKYSNAAKKGLALTFIKTTRQITLNQALVH